MINNYDTPANYGKGMGWIPDVPDERDYDLYDEIYGKYGNIKDQTSALQDIQTILEDFLKESNPNASEIREKLSNLDKKLNKFDFFKTKTHRLLRLGDKGKRILLLKTSLIYFYQNQIDIRRDTESDFPSEPIRKVLESLKETTSRINEKEETIKEREKPLDLIKQEEKELDRLKKKKEEIKARLKTDLANEALRGITHSIVDSIGNAINDNPLFLENLKQKDIKLITYDAAYYSCDDCDAHGKKEREDLNSARKATLNKLNDTVPKEDRAYYPLGFLKEPEKYWEWIKHPEFCFIVEALVKGFQSWARYKICSLKAEKGKSFENALTSIREDLPREYIKPDGIFGINTYSVFKSWLVDSSLEHIEKPYQSIPFPSSIPSEVIEVIANKFQEKLKLANESESQVIEEIAKIKIFEDFEKTTKELAEAIKNIERELNLPNDPIHPANSPAHQSRTKKISDASDLRDKLFDTMSKLKDEIENLEGKLPSGKKYIKLLVNEVEKSEVEKDKEKSIGYLPVESVELSRENKESFSSNEVDSLEDLAEKMSKAVLISENLISKVGNIKITSFSDLENRKEMLRISRQHFFEIEPVVSVVFQILGALGAYPKTLETALELSVEVFCFLLSVTTKEIDEIRDSSFHQIASYKNEHAGKLFNKYIALGNRDELPEKYFLKIQGDIENLQRLKALVTESIQVCSERLSTVNATMIAISGRDLNPDPASSPEHGQEEFLLLNIKKIIAKLKLKDKVDESSCDHESIKGKFNASTVLEFDPSDLNREEEEKASSIKKEKASRRNQTSLEEQENNIYQTLSSSYVVPVGQDFLENVRDLKNAGELCSARHFSYLPKFVDLSFWCSPITDQGNLRSCSAQAGASLIEYFAQRYIDEGKPVSRRFLYKTARNLEKTSGDTGTSLRATIKAMVLFGTPPEVHWNYDENKFDEEPTAFCYSFGQNYQTLSYFRLDHPNVSKEDLLVRIKIALASGFPCMFGFTSYESIHDEFNAQQGDIPYPGNSGRKLYRGQFNQSLSRQDKPIGSHALVAVGYSDLKSIKHSNNPKTFSEGAILVRNSWGVKWGLNGYGWLPYDYILKGQTADWWSLLKSEWLASGKFGLGGSKGSGGMDSDRKTQN